jgi:pilus assembly protein CpaB
MPDKNDLTAALYKAADHKTRQYGIRAGLFLVLALMAAVGSALLLTRYMEARTAEAHVPTRAVVVADKELPVGTELRVDQLRAIAWPMASLPEGSFANPKDLEGKVVSVRLYKGEPILPPKLSGGDVGLSALLPAGMRAAAVRVDDVVGVAGFIHPSDIVDVIATVRQEGSGATTSSKIILQAIKVLAVGKELDHRPRGSDQVVPATVATLMVDADQSERLALAAAQGKILLTLRSQADTSLVATKGVSPNSLLAMALDAPPAPAPAKSAPKASPARRHVVAKAPVVEPPPKPSEVVEIMRGDVFERRDFQKDTKR